MTVPKNAEIFGMPKNHVPNLLGNFPLLWVFGQFPTFVGNFPLLSGPAIWEIAGPPSEA